MKKLLSITIPLLMALVLCLPGATVSASELAGPKSDVTAQASPVRGTGTVIDIATDSDDGAVKLTFDYYVYSNGEYIIVEGDTGGAAIAWQTENSALGELLLYTDTELQGLGGSGDDNTLMIGDTVDIRVQAAAEGSLDVTFDAFRENASVASFSFVIDGDMADIEQADSAPATQEPAEEESGEPDGQILSGNVLDSQKFYNDILPIPGGDNVEIHIVEQDDGSAELTIDLYRDNHIVSTYTIAVTEGALAKADDSWSGSVATSDGSGAAGATIRINGVETQSDADGIFAVSVPRAADRQYVISAAQDGYLPISQIHIGGAIDGLVLELQPVEQYTVDPTQPIAQVDSRDTQISIGPDSLVDANGNLPAGDVTMNMYTYDLANEEMVGNMSGTNSDGEMVSMESAGAFYTSFEDEAGTELNLADGTEAEISIPAERQNESEAPTVWSYNEETGLWEEEGAAVLVDGRYVASVSHFSNWNFDWEMREPACIKLDIEQEYLANNNPLQVRAVLQTNPASVRDLSITEAVNVLVNLPTNTDVKFYMAPDYTNPFATTNSGTPWGSVGTPAYPYNACKGVTEITAEPALGSIAGQVTDAVTGNPIPNAQVCVQDTTQCVNTDDKGNYTIADVAPGDKVLNVKADGYIPVDDQSVAITAGETASVPVPMSPELAVGELRIVLTWGNQLKDLDSSLWLPDGTLINYNKKGQTIQGATLDLDDQDGDGPETFTITDLVDGTYTFAVHNFSRHDGKTTMTVPQSAAVVRVYRGTQEINSFPAPTSGDDNWWHVFDIDGANGTVSPVNTVSANSPK